MVNSRRVSQHSRMMKAVVSETIRDCEISPVRQEEFNHREVLPGNRIVQWSVAVTVLKKERVGKATTFRQDE